MTATLTENGQPAAAGRAVEFDITGANAQQATRTTNAAGRATFTYTGANAGIDAIRATHDDRSYGSTTSVRRTWSEATMSSPPRPRPAAPGRATRSQRPCARSERPSIRRDREDFEVM